MKERKVEGGRKETIKEQKRGAKERKDERSQKSNYRTLLGTHDKLYAIESRSSSSDKNIHTLLTT